MYKWFVKFVVDFYALDFYCDSTDPKKARAKVRRMFGYKRLPYGTQVWMAEA